ncbi:MAG TPA: hypothetical protein VGU20_07835 [Stellaceae bacterium]|nr:hypothetical protein [Stellaceae bacterium]
MAIDQQYREKAKEARERAEASNDKDIRRTWVAIAKGLEWLAEQPPRDPVWRVERVKRSKMKGEPTLSDVLSGAVTQRMMAADQVEREEVERLMAETRRNREGTEP